LTNALRSDNGQLSIEAMNSPTLTGQAAHAASRLHIRQELL
jgi:hypothetical protein